MDRLAHRIVKQARGTPAIADERALHQRWAQAAADAGLTFTPVFLQHEWEQVILGQDLHTEQAYLTCLTVNYRTTQEILAWAVPLLGAAPVTGLDGEADTLMGYCSPMHGRRPEIRKTASHEQELTALTERIRGWLDAGIEPHAIGVAARASHLARDARDALKGAGISTCTSPTPSSRVHS